MKSLIPLLLSTTLLSSPFALANGSTTLSEGSEKMASGSVLVLAGGASIIHETAEASGELIVDSIKASGEVVVITLSAAADSTASVIMHLSKASEVVAELALGTVITASAVTTSAAAGTSILLGHLLIHAGEVLLFIPHNELAIGLHSHAM